MLSILDFFPESLAVHNFSNMFYQLSLSFCPEPGSFHVLSAKFVNFLEARFFSTEAEPFLCSLLSLLAKRKSGREIACRRCCLVFVYRFFSTDLPRFLKPKCFIRFALRFSHCQDRALERSAATEEKKCIFP